jgi:hypothetical protein
MTEARNSIKNNVWLYRMGGDVESNLMHYFRNNGRWGKVIWHDNEYIRKRYDNKTLYDSYDKSKYLDIPDSVYNHVYNYLYNFIDMYVRWSPWSSDIYDQKNIHDYLNIFNRYVNFTYKILLEEEIDLVIFKRAPHLGGDFILYLLAECLGIKTLLLEQSKFPNKYFHYFNMWDFGSFETSKEIKMKKKVSIKKEFNKNLVYMSEIYQKKTKTREKVKKYIYDEYRLLIESIHKEGWQQSLYRYKLRKQFKTDSKSVVTVNPDLDRPFVYFALHKQPEQTTSIWGGKYCDQLLALEKLSSLIPDDWKIYVKENPIQDFYMRGTYFYERFRLIPKVCMVPPATGTYELLEKCQFASTITGTVGWEAISGGKNVLVFGWGVWYKTLPGVFEYHENLKINDIINYRIDHEQLEEGVAQLQTKMGDGYIYESDIKEYDMFNKNINSEQIIKDFEKILYDSSV